MNQLNLEIKARCADPEGTRQLLISCGAQFRGKDHQIDTYFCVSTGRLKLRQGGIENALIFYERADEPGPKASHAVVHETGIDTAGLKDILIRTLGVLVVVEKERDIYFLGNVKFHIDQVKGLGSFVEIEVMNQNGAFDQPALLAQCLAHLTYLGISRQDLISRSYSDLLLEPVSSQARI